MIPVSPRGTPSPYTKRCEELAAKRGLPSPRAAAAPSDSTGVAIKTNYNMSVVSEQFKRFDKDGSGYLEREECMAALATLGSKLSFKDVDQGGDGLISLDEFKVVASLADSHAHPVFKAATKAKAGGGGQQVVVGEAHLNETFQTQAAQSWRKLAEQARAGGFDETSIHAAFSKIDIDQSGTLSPGEVRLAIKALAPQLGEHDITIMLACANADGSGGISELEFTEMMLYKHEQDTRHWEKPRAKKAY